jgi:hypothetical protein
VELSADEDHVPGSWNVPVGHVGRGPVLLHAYSTALELPFLFFLFLTFCSCRQEQCSFVHAVALELEVGKGGMRPRSTIQNVRWCYHVTQSQHGQSLFIMTAMRLPECCTKAQWWTCAYCDRRSAWLTDKLAAYAALPNSTTIHCGWSLSHSIRCVAMTASDNLLAAPWEATTGHLGQRVRTACGWTRAGGTSDAGGDGTDGAGLLICWTTAVAGSVQPRAGSGRRP